MATLDNSDNQHIGSITALYDSREAVEKTVLDLKRAGIPMSDISLSGQDSDSEASLHEGEGSGLWRSIKDMFLPDVDRYAYVEAVRRGGYVLAVQTDPANRKWVENLLGAGSVQMKERQDQWRKDGWEDKPNTNDTGVIGMPSDPQPLFDEPAKGKPEGEVPYFTDPNSRSQI